MIQKEMVIKLSEGLKARPVATLVQVANRFESQILIESGNKKVNAKSIMGVLSLGIRKGESIFVLANGKDENAAVDALQTLVDSNFAL